MQITRPHGLLPSSIRLARTAAAEDHEAALSRFYEALRDRDGSMVHHLLRQPLSTLGAALNFLHLPVLQADVNRDDTEGAAIHFALAQRHTLRRFLPHAAVLVLHPEPGSFLIGHSRQTVRRMVRKAERAGVHCAPVDDMNERRELLKLADEYERSTAHRSYRNPDADNTDLLGIRTCFVARAADGRPLVLSITPVEGEWALLRYFRTFASGPEYSLARYALTAYLAENLAQSGVRYLFDETSPAHLPNGLRHYQRMVGFRLFRTRVTGRSRRSTAAWRGVPTRFFRGRVRPRREQMSTTDAG